MDDIGFFFEYNNKVVQLPINPPELSVKFAGKNQTTEIIQLGEINLLKDRALASVSFDCFFPYGDWFPAVRTRGQFEGPDFYKSFFTGLQEDMKYCRLIITGIGINMLVSVEDFEFTHKAGEHEDAYYKLSLKEYRVYSIGEAPLGALAVKSSGSITTPKTSSKTASKPSQVTVGCTITLNGQVHADSYGAKPGKTFKNYNGRVSLINNKGAYPYHITTPTGSWLGWVSKESVTLV